MTAPPTELNGLATLLTAGGRGAVATVRIIGSVSCFAGDADPLFRAANGKPVAEQLIDRIVFGQWGRAIPEDVVLCRIDDRTTEIHCHGGVAASRRILRDLAGIGFATIAGKEFVQRTHGEFAAECQHALSRARTQRTAEILLEQAGGLFVRTIAAIATDPMSPDSQATLQSLLAGSDFGRHLTQPWRVVIAGRPNVGKSNLINALAGYARSIVYDEPGTTRDVVTVDVAFDGWPVELVDTAGIRETAESLESAGINRAREVIATADCRLLLLDVSQPLTDADFTLLQSVESPILIAHKSDLSVAWEPEAVGRFGAAMPVSSRTGAGVSELMTRIVESLIPAVPQAGTAIPFSERQVELLQQASDAIVKGDAVSAKETLQQVTHSSISGE